MNIKKLVVTKVIELQDSAELIARESKTFQETVHDQELKETLQKVEVLMNREDDQMRAILYEMKYSGDGLFDDCCWAMVEKAREMHKLIKDPYLKDVAIIDLLLHSIHGRIAAFTFLNSFPSETGGRAVQKALADLKKEEEALLQELIGLLESEVGVAEARIGDEGHRRIIHGS